MPIPKKDINTNVIQITPNETVEEVLMWLPADRTARAFCYVVLAVEEGRYIVVPWIEIEQIAARMRQDISSMRIAALDGLPPPVTAIERYGVSIHWAREECDRQPGKRLVVVTNGVVVGLLTGEKLDVETLPADPFASIPKRRVLQDIEIERGASTATPAPERSGQQAG